MITSQRGAVPRGVRRRESNEVGGMQQPLNKMPRKDAYVADVDASNVNQAAMGQNEAIIIEEPNSTTELLVVEDVGHTNALQVSTV